MAVCRLFPFVVLLLSVQHSVSKLFPNTSSTIADIEVGSTHVFPGLQDEFADGRSIVWFDHNSNEIAKVVYGEIPTYPDDRVTFTKSTASSSVFTSKDVSLTVSNITWTDTKFILQSKNGSTGDASHEYKNFLYVQPKLKLSRNGKRSEVTKVPFTSSSTFLCETITNANVAKVMLSWHINNIEIAQSYVKGTGNRSMLVYPFEKYQGSQRLVCSAKLVNADPYTSGVVSRVDTVISFGNKIQAAGNVLILLVLAKVIFL